MLSFSTEKPLWFILFCLLAAATYCYLLYKNEKTFSAQSKFVSYALYSLRFVSVFIIAFLLLSPLIKNISRKIEKPIIVVAQDNSQSILINRESDYYKKEYKEQLKNFISKVSEKFEVKTYLFGDNILESNNPTFSDKQTDMAGMFEEIENKFSGRNLGALVLATDGIYNEGINPFYSINNIIAPIYTVALGDTTVRQDLILKRINNNKYAYLGNTFPVEVVVEAKQFKGKQAKLSISKDGKLLSAQTININNNGFISTVYFQLNATEKGLNQYTLQLQPLAGEITLTNNVQDIFIEVLDGQQQILILAAAPHPDISAIRKSIEKNENYECEVYIADQFNKPLAKYSLIILHNLPSIITNAKIITDISKSDVPVLIVAGTQTNFTAFNNLQTGVSIYSNNNKFNECQASIDKGFSLFTTSERFNNTISNFPPLQCSFGSYKVSNSAITLFKQRNGNIVTNDPMVVFNTNNGHKYGVICGDGIWRWQLADFQENNNHDVFNEFIGKTIQFLAAKEDKSLFRVNGNNNYFENENIEFNSELYNESYELINDKDVQLIITNNAGKQYSFAFTATGNGYKLNAGLLPPGKYNYIANAKVGSKNLSQSGKFTVSALVAEASNTTANHALLYQISAKTNGKLFYKNQFDKLLKELENRADIKPVIYSEKQLNDAVNLKWILALLLFLITVEWFIRKRSGGY